MARHLTLLLVLCALALLFRPARGGEAANPYVMQVDMHGDQVVPSVPSTGWGFVRFFFTQDRSSADYTVDVKGFSGSIVLGADIRRGFRGSNGPIIQHLADGGFITTGGHMNFSPADLDDMAKGGWYVTLYTSQHPDGEMRGQVILPGDFRPAPPPTVSISVVDGQTHVNFNGQDYVVPQGGSVNALIAALSATPSVPGAAIVPGSLAPGQVEIAPPPGPLPGSATAVSPVIITAPIVVPPPAPVVPAVNESQVAAPPAAPVAAPPANVIISPPNTGDGGLVGVGKSPLTAALVGISTLVFGVGLLVLSGRI